MGGLNYDAAGATSEPGESSWTSKDALIYALGVGCGTDHLQFTTENTQGVPQQVLPTMGVVLGSPGPGLWDKVGEINWVMLLHAEQAITLHKPIPVEGKVRTVGKLIGIYDKGSGALVVTENSSVDAETGEPLFTNRTSAFIRGEGGWGGDRGPSVKRTAPERAPDHEITLQTRDDQALIYRLSGDRNPLHSDPSFAKAAGFDKPIIHGLCTYGFTGRALLQALCDDDPTRFRSMDARFTQSAFPGDALTVSIWRTGGGEAFFQTRRNNDAVVIDGGLCTFD